MLYIFNYILISCRIRLVSQHLKKMLKATAKFSIDVSFATIYKLEKNVSYYRKNVVVRSPTFIYSDLFACRTIITQNGTITSKLRAKGPFTKK